MPSPTTSLKASASFDVRPVRSQVVLVGLTITAIVALLLGGVLLGLDKHSGWAFFATSVLLCGAVVWCWKQSQRDADLAQSHPTKVVLSDGANLSTDSRLLSSPEGVRNMAQMLEALALRQPLPEPAGLVGPGSTLIPGSKQEAVDAVAKINMDTQKSHDQAILALKGQLAAESFAQPPDDGTHAPSGAMAQSPPLNAILQSGTPSDTDRGRAG
jgi:hypothetical protein